MKSFPFVVGILGLLTVLLFGCQSGPDLDALRAEILDLHKQAIKAHLEKDVDFFVRDLSNDFFFVSYGEIRFPTTNEVRLNFAKYLRSTTFTEYRDLSDPIISISRDGTMAWAISHVQVSGSRAMSDGSTRELNNAFAWITLYEREGNTWIRRGEVSTNN